MKGKQTKWIGFGAIIAVCVASILTVILLILNRDTTEVAYTYDAVADNLPEYDTDLFQIDGKLDEEIYDELRWWEESYSEGEMQEPVKVRTTAYLGENGVYFIFDVDDDNVNVDMTRASYNNSSITVYAAEEGTHTLEDNVWEIDILPTDYINAKRYLGGYYYGTVRANGYKNQPFVRTATKGGAVNTPECKGYIMESYFPYGFLFKDGEKPENLNLNFALQRSYSLESDARDVYYNFGQNVMSNWSWGDPGTWWTFNKEGLDSVDLIFEAENGGKLEHRNDYIARYQTEKIKIVPDEGYRISSLLLEVNGETSNITNQIVWENEVNYIKLRNVTHNVKLKATFEKIPTTKMTLAGRVTGNGKTDDVGIRFICGGIAYTTTVAEGGTYHFEVPTGAGVLEVYSKEYDYVAKRIKVAEGSGTVTNNIKLTANDYGNKRVMSLPSEQVMGNKERLFNGEKMTGSMSKTFAYDFTLKYNGQLLEENGTPVADPTFGEYDNQYTSINIKGVFTDADRKAIEKSDMQLQIMSWNGDGMWMIKMWLDSQYVEARLGIDELKAFGSEEGVEFRLIFANSKLSLCIVRGNNIYKVTEIKTTATDERYLKYIDFYAEHCINHSIWYVEDQTLALGRTESDSRITANVANGDGVVTFKKSENGKVVRTATNWDAHAFNGAFGWTGTLQAPGVLKNGKIQYHEMKTGYWVDTSKNDKDWYQFTVYIIGDGDSYYVTKNNQKTKLELNEAQIKLLGTTGLQVGAFVNGNAVSYFVDNGKGEMVVFADLYDFNENQAWYPWPNKYGGAYLIHEGAKSIGEVISTGAEFYTGLSKEMDIKGFVKDVIGNKYQSNQTLNPVTHTFDSEKNNYFVMNHKDVAENAFYGYNILLDEWKNTSVFFNVKAWSEEYYASFVKLRVTEDTAYFIWQQGVSPYLCSEAIYFLNETQIAKLTNGGLDIFIEYKEHSTEMNLYVDDGKGNIVLASTYKDSLFRKKTGVKYVKNLIGYSVEVENSETDVTVAATGCVVTESGNFASDVKALYNKSIIKAEQQAKLIKIDSRELKSSNNKINLDYYDFNIGGNWFDKFNVKLPDAVDKDGTILTDCTVKLTARMQGDEYYGQNIYLQLEKDSIGYLEFIYYGGNWESYYYRMTDKQLAQLASHDGLNLFVGHQENENQVTLYLVEGSELIPLKSFAYGETELWAKGYSASYEGEKNDNINVTVDCYKHAGNLLDAIKQAYGEKYTVSEQIVPIARSIHTVNSPADKVNVDYGNLTISGTWMDHYNVKLDGVVDTDGNIKKEATVKLMARLQGNQYFGQSANIRLTESGAYLEMPNYGIEDNNWSTYVYPLNATQLKKLVSEDGMDIYISHAADNKITVYLADGENLIAVKEFTYGSQELKAKGYSASYVGDEADDIQILAECVPYSGTIESALKDLYGQEYSSVTAAGKYSYNYVVKEDKFSKEFTEEDSKALETYTHMWDNYFYKINIHNDGVDKDGNVLAASEMRIQHNGLDAANGYKGSAYIYLYLKEDGSSIKFTRGYEPWTSEEISLTTTQLKAIGSDNGLNLYIAHSSTDADAFTVYVEIDNKLLEMFTYEIPGANHGELCKVTYSNFTENMTVSGQAYNYADTDFVTVVKTIYGENFELRNRVDVNVEVEGAVINGMKDIYHMGDTVSFTVQVDEGYKLETVTLNESPLTANADGKYQFELTEAEVTSCDVKVTTSLDNPYYSFAKYTTTQANLDVATMNKMKEAGDYFLFQTNMKLAEFSKVEESTNAHVRVLFDLPGSGNTPVYRVMLYKENGKSVLKISIHNDSAFGTLTKELTSAQVAKIEGNAGLNVFLVQTGETTYTLYVEVGDTKTVEKVEGSTYTYAGANHVSQYRYDTKTGKTPTVVTTGYFYKQNKIDGAQLANTLLGSISEDKYEKFAQYTTGQANFDVATMNKMKESGDYFLFKTNFKLAGFSQLADNATSAHARVLFDLPGNNNTPVYRVMLHRENGKSVLKINIHNDSSFETLSKELTATQVAKIEGNAGLNVFLIQTGETSYTLYVEAGDTKTVEKVEGSTYTYAGANHVSQYRCGSQTNQSPTIVTTGYFYKQEVDGAQVANELLGN